MSVNILLLLCIIVLITTDCEFIFTDKAALQNVTVETKEMSKLNMIFIRTCPHHTTPHPSRSIYVSLLVDDISHSVNLSDLFLFPFLFFFLILFSSSSSSSLSSFTSSPLHTSLILSSPFLCSPPFSLSW